MPQIARVGDRTQGVCTAHPVPINVGGTISAGASATISEGQKVARIGDQVDLDCGHTTAITSGSTDVIVEGKSVARLGDQVNQSPYIGTIVSAGSTVSAN